MPTPRSRLILISRLMLTSIPMPTSVRPRRLNLGYFLFLPLVLAAFASLSCLERRSVPEYGLEKKNTLRINIMTEPPSLDWHKATDLTSSRISGSIMEGLVALDVKDPELGLLPALATKWEPFNRAQKWVFTMRKGVVWTDGVAFTPQHILDGWERLLNPLTAAPYAYFLFSIKNARAYNEGKIKKFSDVGVKINAKGQIEVELVGSQSFFPYMLNHQSTFPIRLDVVAKHGNRWTEAENMVSLGPYRLKIWEHDRAIVLTRNPSYYGTPPKIQNILAYMIENLATGIDLLKSGQLDFQSALPSVLLSKLSKRPDFHRTSQLGIYYYGMNVKKPPMDDIHFRKAVAHAIDREEIVRLSAGGQIPTSSFVPKGMFGYEPEVGLKFDVKKAKESFRRSRYFKNREQMPRLVLAFNTSEDHKRLAENVQAQLKRNLGIEVELRNEEWKVYISTLQVDAPTLYRSGWVADYPDPDNFLNMWTSFSENNNTNWGDKKYDELVARGAVEMDNRKRREIYRQAQKYLLEEEVPIIPIYIFTSNLLISNRIVNPFLNAMSELQFKEMELRE